MFSRSTEYALRATIFIARSGTKDRLLTIDDISIGIGSPKAFTSKILQKLTGANGVVVSYKGPNGGFRFAKECTALPIIHILRLMGEVEVINKCIMGLSHCSDANKCPMHNEYKPIKKQIINLFEQQTIGDLINGKLKL